MMFAYEIENNGVKVPLVCECSYDYCAIEGPSACLTKALIAGWNLVGLMTEEQREEIEEFYLDNYRELDK